MWILGLLFFAIAVCFFWPHKVIATVAHSPPDRHSPPVIGGPGEFDVEVVGESNYQHQLIKICGERTSDGALINTRAMLLFDDTNKYDKRAVRVDIDGGAVGYLCRDSARAFRRSISNSVLRDYSTFQCEAVIAGGWDRGDGDTGMYGVRLDLPVGMT